MVRLFFLRTNLETQRYPERPALVSHCFFVYSFVSVVLLVLDSIANGAGTML